MLSFRRFVLKMLSSVLSLLAGARADGDAGANVFHLKFRSRTLNEYIEQLSIFGEEVKPLL